MSNGKNPLKGVKIPGSTVFTQDGSLTVTISLNDVFAGKTPPKVCKLDANLLKHENDIMTEGMMRKQADSAGKYLKELCKPARSCKGAIKHLAMLQAIADVQQNPPNNEWLTLSDIEGQLKNTGAKSIATVQAEKAKAALEEKKEEVKTKFKLDDDEFQHLVLLVVGNFEGSYAELLASSQTHAFQNCA